MKALNFSIFRYLMMTSLLMLLAPMTVHAQSAGNVNWEGWTLDYEVSSRFDGMSLSNVSYQGVKVLARASMPVMTVFYENNACGPYADRLGGTGLPVDWAGNSSVVNRTFTQNGETWREIGFQDKIGAYILYQVWYLSGSGQIEAHIFAKGLQCQTDHLHYPFWRLDFDLSGPGDDQIRRHTGTAWEVYSNEFDAAATAANNHQWQVRDLGNGMTVDIAFDTNTWNVPGTVIPETMYANNQVYGRLYQSSEAGGWTDGAITSVQGNNGEDINGQDNVFWYRGYLPHLASEGGELWHSTGIRLTVSLPGGPGGNNLPTISNPGAQSHIVGDTVNLPITASDPDGDTLTYSASGLPAGLSINSASGAITGTINAVGQYNVTITVDDEQGGSVSTDFTWTVTNLPSEQSILYLSSTSGGSIGGVSFADEDILVFDRTTNSWSLHFDGSDVGLSGPGKRDTNAFQVLDDGTLLLSFTGDTTIPNVGAVDNSDIVRFVPSSLGTTTSGTFELYFDGSDVGLTTNGEKIDALHVLADGRLVISTSGTVNVIGTKWKDEDLLVFTPTSLGATTSGSWALYFDGSDVGLNQSNDEDIFGIWIADSGEIYLTTRGIFSVNSTSGDGADVLRCTPSSLGTNTGCTFDLNWDGSLHGFGTEIVDGLSISRP